MLYFHPLRNDIVLGIHLGNLTDYIDIKVQKKMIDLIRLGGEILRLKVKIRRLEGRQFFFIKVKICGGEHSIYAKV